MHHLVLSPHLDDAALSAGGLIDALVAGGDAVTVATFATADADPRQPLGDFAEGLHRYWNLGPHPFAIRRDEDRTACRLLGARPLHGGHLDALYRRSTRDGEPLYADIRALFAGAPAAADPAVAEFKAMLEAWIDETRPGRLHAPLGIGGHVDHAAVHAVARDAARRRGLELWLYEDMPYALGRFPPDAPDSAETALRRSGLAGAMPERVPIRVRAKLAAIEAYGSQLEGLFGSLEAARRDTEAYALEVGGGRAAERFWRLA